MLGIGRSLPSHSDGIELLQDHHRIPQREVIKMGKNCVGTKHVLWHPISIGLSTWLAGRVVQWWRPDRVGTCCRHPRKERRLVTSVGGGILTIASTFTIPSNNRVTMET